MAERSRFPTVTWVGILIELLERYACNGNYFGFAAGILRPHPKASVGFSPVRFGMHVFIDDRTVHGRH